MGRLFIYTELGLGLRLGLGFYKFVYICKLFRFRRTVDTYRTYVRTDLSVEKFFFF